MTDRPLTVSFDPGYGTVQVERAPCLRSSEGGGNRVVVFQVDEKAADRIAEAETTEVEES